MVEWKIYYEDGSTYSNLDGEFKDAPCDGVQGVVTKDYDCGRLLLHGFEHYYVLEDGTVGACNDLGPFLRKTGLVKYGRWIGNKPYRGTLKKMAEDPDFPPKSAVKRGERVDGR